VWTIPADLVTGPLLEEPADPASWGGGRDGSEERSACFRADADGNVPTGSRSSWPSGPAAATRYWRD
jgi:hypothetical protein